MISIRVISGINEYPLALGNLSQTSIEEFVSYLDVESAIKSGFTMNVIVPIEGNEVPLQHKHLIWKRDNNEAFRIRIYDDQQSYDATLVIEKSTINQDNAVYDADIIFSTFPVLINDVLLKDALDHEIVFGETLVDMLYNISDNYTNGGYPNQLCCFPEMRIIGNDDETVIANQWVVGADQMLGPGTDSPDFSNPTIPQPYYLSILDHLFRFYGYRITGPALDDEFIKAQTMPNPNPMYHVHRNNELLMATTEEQLFETRTPVQWGEVLWNSSPYSPTVPGTAIFDNTTLPGYYQYIELKLKVKSVDPGGKVRLYRRSFDTWEPGFILEEKIDFFVVPGDVIEYAFFVPHYSVTRMLTLELNCVDDNIELEEMGPSTTEYDDPQTFVLDKGSTIKCFFKNSLPQPELRRYMRLSMNLNEMVPPTLKVSEFLLAIKQLFHLDIDIDEASKKVFISTAKDKISNTRRHELDEVIEGYIKEQKESRKFAVNWKNQAPDLKGLLFNGTVPSKASFSNPLVEDSYIYVQAENAYYSVVGGTLKYLGVRNDVWYHGEGKTEVAITIPIELIQMRSDASGDAFGVLPTIVHDGSGPYQGIKDDEWNLMVMTYCGLYPNGEERNKPFATSASYDWRGALLPFVYYTLNELDISIFGVYHLPLLKILANATHATIKVPKNYSLLKSLIRGKNVYWKSSEFLVVRTEGVLGDLESNTEIELLLK